MVEWFATDVRWPFWLHLWGMQIPDCIQYAILRRLSERCMAFLLALFNRIWRECSLPEAWMMVTMFTFQKPGRNHSTSVISLVIALTSCVCELLKEFSLFPWTRWPLTLHTVSSAPHAQESALFSLGGAVWEILLCNQNSVTVLYFGEGLWYSLPMREHGCPLYYGSMKTISSKIAPKIKKANYTKTINDRWILITDLKSSPKSHI